MSQRPPVDDTTIAALSIALPRLDGVTVQRDAPIDRMVALRTGGLADLLVHTETPAALIAATELLKRVKCPWRVLWPFDPMVAKDGGIQGAALTLGAGFECLEAGPAGAVTIGAATPFAALAAAGPDFATLATWSGTPGALLASGQGHRLAGPCAAITAVTNKSMRRRTIPATASPGSPSRATTPVSIQLRPVPPATSAPLLPGQLLAPDGPLLEVGGTSGEVARTLADAGLAESRLRGWTISHAWPGLAVQSGDGTAADLELFARALAEKLHRENGMVTKVATRTFGRPPTNTRPRKR
jgi:UDP-N-acetylenolpyruvoylglucosamine reductase